MDSYENERTREQQRERINHKFPTSVSELETAGWFESHSCLCAHSINGCSHPISSGSCLYIQGTRIPAAPQSYFQQPEYSDFKNVTIMGNGIWIR